MAGNPLKRKFPDGLCGARTRKGTACRCRQVFKGDRCKFHGGMSTGPRTPEGKARLRPIALANLAKTPTWRRRAAKGETR